MMPDLTGVRGTPDPRAVDYKIVEIDGQKYLINVMPAGPEEHDETAWRFPMPHLAQDYATVIYNGPSGISAGL